MKNAKLLSILFLAGLILASCSNKLDNSVTITNNASENIYLNFLGKVFTLKPTKTLTITEISKGSYDYQTAYDIPTAAKGSSEMGAVNGTILMYPQRKATLFYTSQLIGEGEETSYVLRATLSYNFAVSDSSGAASVNY